MTSIMTTNENGDREWRVDGELHREGDLPAVERTNGDKFWYINGKFHREGDFPPKRGQMDTRLGGLMANSVVTVAFLL